MDQKPFPCAQHRDQFTDTYGPFFEIVKALPPLSDAQCVWGGTDCSFDDMIEFVNRTSVDGRPKHKFIAGGLLFSLEYRLSSRTIPSVPLLEDRLIIIGPRNDDRVSWANAWEALWRPFTTKAWVMLFLTTGSVIFLRVWISFHFTDPFTWQQFRDNLLGDYIHTNIGNANRVANAAVERHKDPAELRRLNSYISNGVKILFVIIILYYEIAVVDFIFQDRQDETNRISPGEFALTKSSTMSRVFRTEFLNRTKRRNQACPRGKPCWLELDTIQDVYFTITSQNNTKSDVHQNSYVYENFNRYWFRRNSSLCGELQVVEYEPLNRKVAGVWYYSSNIELERRVEIDRAILDMRERDEVRSKLYEVTGSSLPPKCETSASISVLLLGVPMFMFPGPIFTLVFFYMVVYTVRWRRDVTQQELDEEQGHGRSDSSDSYIDESMSYDTSMMDSRKCDCFSSQSSELKVRPRIQGPRR